MNTWVCLIRPLYIHQYYILLPVVLGAHHDEAWKRAMHDIFPKAGASG